MIAAITGVPVWIAKARMLSAREKLRRFLPGGMRRISHVSEVF
jgi:hypothetical protein